jgi:cytochrome c peroxidase
MILSDSDMGLHLKIFLLFCSFGCILACGRMEGDEGDLTQFAYKPTPYSIQKPAHFPEMAIPAGNPMTKEGIALGRMLFYDPILSADSTQSCSSCHFPEGSFTDQRSTSAGIDGILGTRSSMSLMNIGFVRTPLFWDGRVASLEDQALLPVEDPIEMHNTWVNALTDLRSHPTYPRMFREAFGMNNKSEITKEHAAKALAQFERIIMSSGKSEFDRFMATNDENVFTNSDAYDGLLLFFDKGSELGLPIPDAECFHCHGGPLASTNNFFNNGLQEAATVNDYNDKGQGGANNNPLRNGFFRAPTLINIALTAPYFHNGSAKSLEEVMEHYSKGGKPSPNKDPLIHKLGLPPTPQGLTNNQKKQIIAFLHAMTDTAAIKNPEIQNPFK